jgi:hypothetical protein
LAVDIHALDLDAFIAATDKPAAGPHLFDPLGVAVAPEALARIVAGTDNRNATERATGSARPKVLRPKTMRRLRRHAGRLDEAIGAATRGSAPR